MRFGPGNNHAVKPVLPQILEREVETVQMPLSAIGARNSGQRVQFDVDRDIAGRNIEKFEELQFRVFQR